MSKNGNTVVVYYKNIYQITENAGKAIVKGMCALFQY